MPWPIRKDLLSALFSLHDFICSKYVEKQEKMKNTQQINLHVLDKKKLVIIEVIFSVSDLELCRCLLVLLASVWPCFASMRYCPFWRILGEKEPHPQGLEEALVPLTLLGTVGAELVGMFNPELSEFPPP